MSGSLMNEARTMRNAGPFRRTVNPKVRERSSPAVAAGFTLIELMIVVVIVGILAAIVYPSYQESVRKSRRAEAKTLLNDAAARQEQYFTQNKQYASTLAQLRMNATSPGRWYSLQEPTVDTSADGTNIGYTLQANPNNAQTSDTKCGSFTLTSTGVRDATGTLPGSCW